MSNRDEPEAAESPLDIAAWRPVLTGLNLMRGALIFAMIGFVFGFVLLIVTTILVINYNMAWLNNWTFGCLGLLVLITTVFLLWGMGLCCLAPRDAGARPYAQAAFVLALTTTALAGGWLALELVILRHVSQDWYDALMRLSYLHNVFVVMLMLNGTLAVVCWHRFLSVVAESFHQADLANLAKNFIRWIFLWAGCATMAWCIGPQYGTSWLALPKLLFVLFTLSSAAPTFIWAVWLLCSVRTILREALQADPAVSRVPPP